MDTVSNQFQTQSLNAVVAGFSFASAIAWMEVVRFLLAKVIKTPSGSASAVILTAILTTFLSIFVYIALSRVSSKVSKPSPVVYAVSGAR